MYRNVGSTGIGRSVRVVLAVAAAVVVLFLARTSRAASVVGTVVDPGKVGIAKATVACEVSHKGTHDETTLTNGSFMFDAPTDSHYMACVFRASGYIPAHFTLKRMDEKFSAGLVVLEPVIGLKAPVRVSTSGSRYLVDAILVNKSANDVALTGFALAFDIPKERSCMKSHSPDVILRLADKVDLATSTTMTADVPFLPLPQIVSVPTTYTLEYDPCVGGVARVPVPHTVTLAAAGKDGDKVRVGILGPSPATYQDRAGGSRTLSIGGATSGQSLTLRVTLDNGTFVALGTAPATVALGPR